MAWDKASFLFFAALLGATPALGQGLDFDRFEERVRHASDIAGSPILGAVYKSERDRISPRDIYVYLEGPFTEPLQFQINTIDGEYYAEAEIAAEALVPGWQRLNYEGRELAAFAGLPIDQVGVLASSGGRVFPVRWGTGAPTDELMVMVNSERASTFTVEVHDQRPKRVDCQPPSDLSPIRFDRICTVDPGAIHRNKDGQVTIRRRDGDAVLSPITFELAAE